MGCPAGVCYAWLSLGVDSLWAVTLVLVFSQRCRALCFEFAQLGALCRPRKEKFEEHASGLMHPWARGIMQAAASSENGLQLCKLLGEVGHRYDSEVSTFEYDVICARAIVQL